MKETIEKIRLLIDEEIDNVLLSENQKKKLIKEFANSELTVSTLINKVIEEYKKNLKRILFSNED